MTAIDSDSGEVIIKNSCGVHMTQFIHFQHKWKTIEQSKQFGKTTGDRNYRLGKGCVPSLQIVLTLLPASAFDLSNVQGHIGRWWVPT